MERFFWIFGGWISCFEAEDVGEKKSVRRESQVVTPTEKLKDIVAVVVLGMSMGMNRAR